MKPLASLSSGLLARKGGAKPAMRRQGSAFPDQTHENQEDLGWNDMGYDVDPDHSDAENGSEGSESGGSVNLNPLAGAIPDPVPVVKKQQKKIIDRLSGPAPADQRAEAMPEKPAPAPVPLSISREVAPLEEHSAVVEAARTNKRRKKQKSPAKRSRTAKAKAAFTLRLDADRHLKLRLATAVKNQSAQQLVTKAVDEYLKNIPELDELAAHVPSRGAA
ncbi:MAG: hypothetical protein AAGE37_11325 [Pseudomonadota bacterium]